nr:MAG TPA: hypothetical protein [Caudoviricetes sp.]DAP44701.1 MAG TPA: hypothetical protein [Bacteriophage sp.]DAS07703.1 MAG TPA: hypothetical protein [Caudoviricetes sp.]
MLTGIFFRKRVYSKKVFKSMESISISKPIYS